MFKTRLKIARKNSGLSHNRLADQLGMTKQEVSNWERGIAKPSLDTFNNLVAVLGVTADYLLGNEYKNQLDTKGLTSEQLMYIQNIINDIRGESSIEVSINEH